MTMSYIKKKVGYRDTGLAGHKVDIGRDLMKMQIEIGAKQV